MLIAKNGVSFPEEKATFVAGRPPSECSARRQPLVAYIAALLLLPASACRAPPLVPAMTPFAAVVHVRLAADRAALIPQRGREQLLDVRNGQLSMKVGAGTHRLVAKVDHPHARRVACRTGGPDEDLTALEGEDLPLLERAQFYPFEAGYRFSDGFLAVHPLGPFFQLRGGKSGTLEYVKVREGEDRKYDASKCLGSVRIQGLMVTALEFDVQASEMGEEIDLGVFNPESRPLMTGRVRWEQKWVTLYSVSRGTDGN